jgi:hypothetical protein
MNLLTTGNPKILKGEKLGYLTNILHLAPSTLSGHNVCPMSTAGCAFACLNTAGRGGIFKKGENTNVIQKARIRKTDWYFSERDAFMTQLAKEITNAIALAKKHDLIPVFRLNGTSDLRWENVPVTVKRSKTVSETFPNIMTAFPDIIFYDYSKLPNRKNLPANYTLTFSRADGNEHHVATALAHGMNIAVVFRTNKLPATYLDLPVIDGDESDLRFLDAKGVIVGLKAKGKAKKDTSGFVVDV